MEEDSITEAIIGSAIEVHRELGPGLLESAYGVCLAYELATGKQKMYQSPDSFRDCKDFLAPCVEALARVRIALVEPEQASLDRIFRSGPALSGSL